MVLILYNANIFQPKTGGQNPTAIAIEDGHILDLGSDAYIVANYGDKAQQEDMEGRTIWPGLTDAHIHLQEYGLSLEYVNCETTSIDICLKRIEDKASQTPPGLWILGHGWNQNDWAEGFGNARLLDRFSADHPVFLTSKSLHSAWVNTRAMQLARITAETPDPDDGVIQRDSQGNPTGILFESAVNLCKTAITQPDQNQIKNALLTAQEKLLSMGVTGVHDFDRAPCFSALQTIHFENQLSLRVVKGIPLEDLPHAVSLGIKSGYGDDFLKIGPVKLFADGALGPHTAAMIAPYEDNPTNVGLLFLDTEQILAYGKLAVENGLSLAIHAIGDKANQQTLDAYQALRAYEIERHLRPLRHRIEHVQVIDPEDQKRIKEYNIIASMQPIHVISDMDMADRYWGKRSEFAYAWLTILANHSVLAFGSDAPVESPNPFWGLHAAVTRRRQGDDSSNAGWHPEQRLSLIQALQAYTTGPAFAAGTEFHSGQISPGYNADLIVLDNDPFNQSAQALAGIQPLATMVNGKWVWKGK